MAVLRAFTAGSLLLLVGCKTMPTGQSLGELVGSRGSVKLGQLPPLPAARNWPDAAQDVRNQRARGYGLVEMPEMQQYLNGLLVKIKQAAGVAEWPGAVYVTAASELSAYCTGAGNIYISLPWLASAESEDEIVALMAHEFGHIYLDSHQLESTIVASDQAAGWAAIGVAIAKKAGNATGWNAVDQLAMAYALGKNSLGPAWSRNDEAAADRFGATVSMRLNYSFSQGFKAFLERQATWEADNAVQQEAARKKLVEQLKSAAASNGRLNTATGKPLEPAVAELQASLNAGLIDVAEGMKQGIGGVVNSLTASHASTDERLTDLTAEMMPFVAGKPRQAATVLAWTQAQDDKRTAAILKNYQKASDAQLAIGQQDFARARRMAQEAASGPTMSHAFPLMVLSMTDALSTPDPRARRPAARAAGSTAVLNPLDRNLNSPPDRAWRIYVTRANNLLGAGQTAQARTVMAQGFDYFGNAPAAWPDAIAFAGVTEGWDRAKQLAQTCAARFPSSAGDCRKAAASPADLAAEQQRMDQKAKSLTDKWLKK